jgi:hypothetical protein
MANKLILSGEFANRVELEEHAYFEVRACIDGVPWLALTVRLMTH